MVERKDFRSKVAPLAILASCGLLIASAAGLALTATSDGGVQAMADEIAQTRTELTDQRDAAQKDFDTTYNELLSQLPGVDAERLSGDTATLRSAVLAVMGTSASNADAKTQAEVLADRYEALSSAGGWFLQDWLAATQGTVYELADLTIEAGAVDGADYSYRGVAVMEPVTGDSPAQILVFRAQTDADGLSAWQGARTSEADAAKLLAEEEEDASQDEADTDEQKDATP